MNSKRFYNTVKSVVRLFFPKAAVRYEEVPAEPSVFVCNHSALRGPVMMTLDFDRPHKNWVIFCAMDRRSVKSYAFHDVFFGNSRRCKGFWRLLTNVVAWALPPILENADAIPVYHDRRMIETFRASIDALEHGEDIVIFGESPKRFSEYVNELQPGFTELGRYYFKKTGKRLNFYPVYIEKANLLISVGAPIAYDPALHPSEQRQVISAYLRDRIDGLARAMKKHKPVPFLTPRWYGAYGQYENDFVAYWKMIENE